MPTGADPGTALWRRWTLAFTLGELIGFGGVPVLIAAFLLWLTDGAPAADRALPMYAVTVVGGLGEGAILGWFQARVLADYLPALSPGRWISATALAACFAWACGMLAPTLDDLVGLSTLAQLLIWIPASLLILLSIGAAQAFVLRGLVARPGRWIVANTLGWLVGLPWTFLLPALVPETSPVAVWIVAFLVSGVLMGLTAGAVTGAFLLRIIRAEIAT